MKKRFLNQIIYVTLLIISLSSCMPKITNVRTNNIVSYYKKGMHINTVDSLGSLSRVEKISRNQHEGNVRLSKDINYDSKQRHQFNININNINYTVIVVGIVNEVREVDRMGTEETVILMGDKDYKPDIPYQKKTEFKNVKINIEIEDDLFLIFKDDKLENWVYLYELLNSPKEKDRKLGDLIASEYIKFKNPKREE